MLDLLTVIKKNFQFLLSLTTNRKEVQEIKSNELPSPVDLLFNRIDPTESIDLDLQLTPIVICPGIFSCKEHWTKLCKELVEQTKRTVYIFDLRDHNLDSWTNDFSFKSMVSDVIHFFNKNKIDQAICMGHSLGGMIMARFASLVPNKVTLLILIDIHPSKERYINADGSPTNIQLMARLFKRSMQTIRNEKLDIENGKKRLTELLAAEIKDEKIIKGLLVQLGVRDNQLEWKFNIDQIEKFLDKLRDCEDVSINFKGPSFLIYGTKSKFFKAKDCETVQSLLPKIKFDFIENADHSLQFNNTKQFLNKTISFINPFINFK